MKVGYAFAPTIKRNEFKCINFEHIRALLDEFLWVSCHVTAERNIFA